MKNLFLLLIALAMIGLVDASYLTYEHYTLAIPPCNLHAWFSDCGTVLTSKYSIVFGIPVALFGAFFYISVLILMLYAFLGTVHKKILSLLCILLTLGAIIALYFIFLQLFILRAICPYCMLSHTVDLLIFGIFWYGMWKYKPLKNSEDAQ